MNDDLLKFAGDKLVPLLLILFAGAACKLGLPAYYGDGLLAAGLLAFQIHPKSTPSNVSQS